MQITTQWQPIYTATIDNEPVTVKVKNSPMFLDTDIVKPISQSSGGIVYYESEKEKFVLPLGKSIYARVGSPNDKPSYEISNINNGGSTGNGSAGDLKSKIGSVNGIYPTPLSDAINVPDTRVILDTPTRLLPSQYIESGVLGRHVIENAKSWSIYGTNKDGLCEVFVNDNNVKQIFHTLNGVTYESHSLSPSSWSDWKIGYEGHTYSLRRAVASNVMALNTPLQLNGAKVYSGDSIEIPTSTYLRVKGGKKYEFAISNLYTQADGANSTATLIFQISSDGVNWTNTSLSRQVSLITNNESIDTTIGFMIYPQELIGGYNWTYFRIMVTALSPAGGINYDIAMEIKEI
ncbi:MAG: hypothetical protein ACRC7W_06665 [Fusobacteriaceae bacterium]